ncbi:MAG: hypothetical protein EAY65_02890 [Alphaproteobacteria bacterium]|nr:MAG: hypothetical protein EAY65_02890 [Alphaproteobacteria bacterium]
MSDIRTQLFITQICLAAVCVSHFGSGLIEDFFPEKKAHIVPQTAVEHPVPDTRVQQAYYQGFAAGRMHQLEELPMPIVR